MKQENRHQAILYAVMRQGYVSIESLAEELGVSSQTIRRDISELDRTGMLERRPGGASCRTTILNSTYDARQVEDFKDKERIARTIAEYIPDNSSIFLTLGTTVEVIAYALLERSGLMVITNNVVAALTLNKKTDFEVVLASGYMRKSSNGLVGESTIEFVNGFQCDYVITSTGGLSEADGHLLDYHTADVSVAQSMMRNANKVLLAASRSKFGRKAVVRVAPLKSVDVLFTNNPVPPRLEEVSQAAGVELIAC
ncbi:DeoR/GlpR family DNA-binding transcription regulator [uncultured Bilophila sp.]|uniref:DeoR/GlpR family DNA-binding transcription regulator n=1 Tax=uncultured Bilophila sp. TaxID=529385 RepID=UPI00280BC3DF|nr:DeoR/GlpR family DNA-binding transcription regulator [uncultured Bilophila sp.]